MQRPIYLDYNATTPVDHRVLARMLPFFTEEFGNPSSRQHPYGWAAEKAVESAREKVAHLIGATPQELIFTSGGTESNNIALQGMFETYGSSRNHIITSSIEHKAVLDVCHLLEKRGADLTVLPVDRQGLVDPDDLKKNLRPSTLFVSVMWANNEIGSLQPIADLARLTHDAGAFFHTDAVQPLGHHPIDLSKVPVDLLTLSGHKIYGPKGIGALYVRRQSPRIRIESPLKGGGQEKGIRPGTLNVPGIVGFGEACEIMSQEGLAEAQRLSELRDFMLQSLNESGVGVTLNGAAPKRRLCNNLSLTFQKSQNETLLVDLVQKVSVSTGSACLSQTAATTGSISHVLTALGLTEAEARGTLRIGLGRNTTRDEVIQATKWILEAVRKNLK